MTETTSCGCGIAPKLVYSCSGAADVGEMCDKAARTLAREGVGKMYCLAGVGGGVDVMVANARGCSRHAGPGRMRQGLCQKNIGERRENIVHLRASDYGFEKGASLSSRKMWNVCGTGTPMLKC